MQVPAAVDSAYESSRPRSIVAIPPDPKHFMSLALLLCTALPFLSLPQESEELSGADSGLSVERLRMHDSQHGNDVTFAVEACWIGPEADPQLLVSVPEEFGDQGGLYVLEGTAKYVRRSYTLPGSPVSRLGKRLESVGDVDGDGAGDFVVFGEVVWPSGQRFDHAFGISSATGLVLFEVEGLHSAEVLFSDLVSMEAFDFDGAGALDFVVQPAGAVERLEVRSGRDGSVLCAFDIGTQVADERLWSVHLAEEPGGGLLALVERLPEADPTWRMQRRLLRVARDGSVEALELHLPRRGRVHGFFDLDGDAESELVMHRLGLDTGPGGAGGLTSQLAVELVGVDVLSGEAELIGTLPPKQIGAAINPRIPQAIGIAEVGRRRVLFTANAYGGWAGDLAAFEIGRGEPLWTAPWPQQTRHVGALLSAPARVDGEVVAAFSDGALIGHGEVRLIVVRLRDGRKLW